MIGSSNLYPVVGVEEAVSSRPGEALESPEAIGHRISRVSQSGMEDFSPSLSVVRPFFDRFLCSFLQFIIYFGSKETKGHF